MASKHPDETYNDDDIKLLTLRETCQTLGISHSQIYRLINSGDLELVKLGRSSRISRKSIDKYVRNAPRPQR